MASAPRAPKQWCLTKHETVNSFENWRQNLIYTLTLDSNFAPFLGDDCSWAKKTKSEPLRGFTDDPTSVPTESRKSAHQKASMLDLMLGQIANFCPVISRNSIVKNSTSLNDIWGRIRLHYGFQSTGAHFLDFNDIKLEPDERPEDLFQRLVAFVEDNLLTVTGGISHHGDRVKEDEELTPTLENFIVLQWLQLINSELPRLVKQRYGTELRSRTLASLKPEISQALDSLLDEIHTSESSRAMRTLTSPPLRAQRFQRPSTLRGRRNPQTRTRIPQRTSKYCPLCREARRPDNHYLSECTYLPEQDRRFIAKARQVANIFESDDENDDLCQVEQVHLSDADPVKDDSDSTSLALRVQVRQSPYFDVFCGHQVVRVTVDSGATGNMIKTSTVQSIHGVINPSSQSAHQADGSSPLDVVGETKLTFTREDKEFTFEGLVIDNLDVDILAGTPFMEQNDVSVRPAKRQVCIGDDIVIPYGSRTKPLDSSSHAIRRAHVLRAPPQSTVLWPGDFVEVSLPGELSPYQTLALEPRVVNQKGMNSPDTSWPSPCMVSSVAGKVRIPNLTQEPKVIRRNEHFCQVRPVYVPSEPLSDSTPPTIKGTSPKCSSHGRFSDAVCLDPSSALPEHTRREFQSLHAEFDDVFDPAFTGYNGAVGPFEAVVNMGPVQPPQRKGRLPLYSRSNLVDLQEKFDTLEQQGVFARPEDVGISVEYLNPSFLVKKANGGSRLVTAFADVGRYAKPQPSLMPDVDSTLRKIGQWKHIIATDLTNAFYQIPLSKASMKYCGVATPYRGVRVYTRCAMGMPGSETALEELMCRVLGDLLLEGIVVKLADDLFCGGETPEELLKNWARVLHALRQSSLHLSPSKTVVCPQSTTILGWIWSQGTLHASPHRIAALALCSPPTTVKGMRSFIGAYKMLARVLPQCASFLTPLDAVVAGRQSSDRISWSDDLRAAFKAAQDALANPRTITLPRPSDQLWIITDGAVKKHGIGATLYVTRQGKPRVAGFFSCKLRERQVTWLPCEIEALSIAAACRHFSPYIIQSEHRACVLTDSKPCVQAFEKLCRGEFSASPRVSTFLSTVSRFQCSIRHLAGSANIPSDFASRNAPECSDPTCQICLFIRQTEDSVVNRVTPQDVLSGQQKLPFTSRPAWVSIQSECQDLRRTHAYLHQGTRPSKKLTNIRDVKRYLRVATIAKDGLLVVRREQALASPRECIVVPRGVLDGLLTSLHLQLDHPTRHQLKAVVNRHFFGLDMDSALSRVTDSCHQCTSLRNAPRTVDPQSASDPPAVVGTSFAADVLKRSKQLILVLRECVTSYTATCFLDDERRDTLRDALIRLCVGLRPLDGPPAVIRTDSAPGFAALRDDSHLSQLRLSLELGHTKNPNKNPVAEKAIRELEDEILRHEPTGGTITLLTLSLVTARLNSRLRSRGLSAREMWTQRDQFTHSQIPLSDADLISTQHEQRLANHPHSERSKAPSGMMPADADLKVGDLVYLRSDRNKTTARPRYLVASVDSGWCNIRKFVGAQLRKSSYRVKMSQCLKVPVPLPPMPRSPQISEDEEPDSPDIQPDVPPELSSPPDSEVPCIPLHEPPTTPSQLLVPDSSIVPPQGSVSPPTTTPPTGRPQRSRHPPARFTDFMMY